MRGQESEIFLDAVHKNDERVYKGFFSKDGFLFPDEKTIINSKYGIKKDYDSTYIKVKDWWKSQKHHEVISIPVLEKLSESNFLSKTNDIFALNYEKVLSKIVETPILSDTKLFDFWHEIIEKYSDNGKRKISLEDTLSVDLSFLDKNKQSRLRELMKFNLTKSNRNSIPEMEPVQRC